MSFNKTNILVTGANGGLGLGICLRLIDDFLKSRNATDTLNIIYTTRSTRKGTDTLKTLQAHLHRYHPSSQHNRATFQAENVELTKLLSVRDLARKLNSSELPQLDAIICNAGIGGWVGLDWFTAIPAILLDIRNNTVWPTFKLGTIGALTKPQLPEGSLADPEPPLGEVFCANLFGHYMLVHWLMPLLRACDDGTPGKIIWVSSLEPQSHHFNRDDLQGLRTDAPYEHGKRLTDILALTSTRSATEKAVASFTSVEGTKSEQAARSVPRQHVYHPGVVVTSVISLYWILQQAYLLGIYLARWVGSPWSNVEPYTAAHGATWLALASEEEIQQAEADAHPAAAAKACKVKWGTTVNRAGRSTVRPTEVDKWGITGSGESFASTWWGGSSGLGRKPGAVEAKAEDVEEFVALGAEVWEEMEELRRDWERRIEESEGNGGA
ncbi:3-keto-steroid reductase [Knufia fluminis]|uniref:3-keto-steroid reductase n=1 Tax=Knufia fluminis TaxID=191047 RepID=A0AAN8I2T0_9EURO|nr:3-keto-steroid reductase [Knufia fluminis]